MKLTLAPHERRQCHDGLHWIPVFAEDCPGHCRYPSCGRTNPHPHYWEVADLRARDLLALTGEAWDAAWKELHRQDPAQFQDEAGVRRELRREARDDDGKARDDRGRKVA